MRDERPGGLFEVQCDMFEVSSNQFEDKQLSETESDEKRKTKNEKGTTQQRVGDIIILKKIGVFYEIINRGNYVPAV